MFRQHRTIPALRLKHRSGGCGTASALPKCSIMSGCGTRIVLRGQKPLALCDRCPCFGSLFPPLAALTFAASSIICAFGLASAAPRSPYRHLELCGIALRKTRHVGQRASPPTDSLRRLWQSTRFLCGAMRASRPTRIFKGNTAQCLYATSTCVVGNGLDRSGALPLQKSSASICFLIPFSAR